MEIKITYTNEQENLEKVKGDGNAINRRRLNGSVLMVAIKNCMRVI
jgi:hypothetical protein